VADIGPVDTPTSTAQRTSVSKKPRKVDEPQARYASKKPAKAATPDAVPESGPRFADLAKVRASNAKLVQVHRTVLQKLAQ
jgi:hypothetical protein